MSGEVIGRYLVFAEIASGGMATVHVGRLLGPVGFARTVAIKRLHRHLAREPEFVSMFLDEARLAARIRHNNVVSTLDVVAEAGELFLVMEYVHGESLAHLLRVAILREQRVPPKIACGIAVGLLLGLHAAHEARSEQNRPLDIVHRDISPQNILVGADGVARVLDFGIAKAADRMHTTRDGKIKGKLRYMSPEQLLGERVTRATDIYSAAVVLWETLTCRRLFDSDESTSLIGSILHGTISPPSAFAPDAQSVDGALWRNLDALVMKGLSRDPADRFPTAQAMAEALEEQVGSATPMVIASWVKGLAGEGLERRSELLRSVEGGEIAIQSAVPHEGTDTDVDHGRKSQLPTVSAALGPAIATGDESTGSRPTRPAPMSIPPIPPPPTQRLWGYGALLLAGSIGGVFALRASLSSAPPTPEPPTMSSLPPAKESAPPAVVVDTAPAPVTAPPSTSTSRRAEQPPVSVQARPAAPKAPPSGSVASEEDLFRVRK